MPPSEQFSAEAVISGVVFYSRTLSDKAKLLYGLLSAMTRPPKYYAFAHNETLARFLNCSTRSVQRYLDELTACGEVTIEGDQGGRKTVRKIRVARLQPFNHDTGVVVNHDTDVVVTNNSINNNIPNRGKKAPPEKVDKATIMEWFDLWAAKLEFEPEQTVALISDLHAFVENRAAKGKPILTINAAGRHAKRLMDISAEYADCRPEAMCYILGEAITRNWEKLYPIDDQRRPDFERWLRDSCGICRTEPDAPVQEGWN